LGLDFLNVEVLLLEKVGQEALRSRIGMVLANCFAVLDRDRSAEREGERERERGRKRREPISLEIFKGRRPVFRLGWVRSDSDGEGREDWNILDTLDQVTDGWMDGASDEGSQSLQKK
jgi:hypothetical protein